MPEITTCGLNVSEAGDALVLFHMIHQHLVFFHKKEQYQR
jgi:hypothetical protein